MKGRRIEPVDSTVIRIPSLISRRGETQQAVILGLVQGPTELLPISSSAHLTMLPQLAGWSWNRLDPELRKSFDIALHGGAALAMVLVRRHEITDELSRLDLRHGVILALSFLPAAVTGLAFERTIESRLGGPRATAAGLILGGLAMALADRRPGHRGRGDAKPADGVALGVAQAMALIPGVSRNGATLTAARLRRFNRDQASLLSRTVALPVILGAVGLKTARLARRRIGPRERRLIGVGFIVSFLSTVASNRLIRLVERDRTLLPWALYRVALGGLILARFESAPDGRPAPDRNGGVESTAMHPDARGLT